MQISVMLNDSTINQVVVSALLKYQDYLLLELDQPEEFVSLDEKRWTRTKLNAIKELLPDFMETKK